ncbi:MAG: isoaspartyl peptidase/L-asparaginase [Thermoprotei archaeon]
MVFEYGIIIHGGAGALKGSIELEKYSDGLRRAVLSGFGRLENGSALDAVVQAVYEMEEAGVFNAGLGCCLTAEGKAEVDAGLMDGSNLAVGAVASLTNIRHPILAARTIMEKTDHVLMVGEGAMRLLGLYGFKPDPELVTEAKLRKLRELKDKWLSGNDKKMARNREVMKALSQGTVGALAIDKNGNIAAAVSTGGYWLKLSGRVGDTPIAGAGFYAENGVGGAVATGIGEYAIRLTLCKRTVDLIRSGLSAKSAAERAISEVSHTFGEGTMGIITIDHSGGYGYSYNTEGMGRAIMFRGLNEPLVGVFQ